jgi:preprotein translocase subunit SecG
MSIFLGFLLSLTAIFLIMLVLVQRGRGGGLAGALGGMGGSSAFGAKAGDVFTKITIVTAAIWILLCVVSVKLLSEPDPVNVTTNPLTGGISAPTDDANLENGQSEADRAVVPAEPSPPSDSDGTAP